MSEPEIPSGATPEISSAQVAAQMKAVAHMARVIAKIHDDLREVGEQCPGLGLWAIWGEESASFMEILGDMLNGMDAVEDEDAWMAPVFAEAQRVWPRAAESWVPPHARAQASRDAADLARQREVIAGLRADKDGAYDERNRLVALLAGLFPSGTARPEIPDWDPEWLGCVYIDFPWGQASWHFHDSQAHLFAHLPPYPGEWDGHTTEAKYEAIARAALSRAQAGDGEAPSVPTWEIPHDE